ncbi:hypothetical protein C5F49_00360 [Nitrosopumilus oxyclinae]|uniref:Uncharacterized protein n=1 Tax=Nitrosopumilus oxyclinae TaxID=1959104 RepID=A0A7D5R7C3_9ARCH|nr:hypothetical protein [Nitrosopumilus oxyclinae]QLH03944.1 hypothetical protein C5F49_00360 [Nitrosopumilus oxyclinae]
MKQSPVHTSKSAPPELVIVSSKSLAGITTVPCCILKSGLDGTNASPIIESDNVRDSVREKGAFRLTISSNESDSCSEIGRTCALVISAPNIKSSAKVTRTSPSLSTNIGSSTRDNDSSSVNLAIFVAITTSESANDSAVFLINTVSMTSERGSDSSNGGLLIVKA